MIPIYVFLKITFRTQHHRRALRTCYFWLGARSACQKGTLSNYNCKWYMYLLRFIKHKVIRSWFWAGDIPGQKSNSGNQMQGKKKILNNEKFNAKSTRKRSVLWTYMYGLTIWEMFSNQRWPVRTYLVTKCFSVWTLCLIVFDEVWMS